MALEIIIFFSAVLFGIFWYWRESVNNGVYRFFNKIFYSEKLQMKPNNRKGFVFEQNIVFRLLYIALLYIALGSILQFLTPLRIFSSYYGFSAFASSIFGALLGTYLANFLVTTSHIVDEKSEDIEEYVKDKLEDGKEFLDDLRHRNDAVVEEKLKASEDTAKKEEKSARDRLKDKGYM